MPVLTKRSSPLTSKQPFVPDSGPVSGLLLAIETNKAGHPKILTVETVRGTLRAKVAKDLRPMLKAELAQGMPVRLWVRTKGDKVEARLVVPLEAKPLVEESCQGLRPACIWVCTSKSCCRRGGSQVLEKLQQMAQQEKERRTIQVKSCGCLGACKKGPSLKIRGQKKIMQVTPCGVPGLLDQVLSSN